jgi:hypothetical protein
MGGIIIDGVTALQFKGSFKKFGEALGHLSKLEAEIDSQKGYTGSLKPDHDEQPRGGDIIVFNLKAAAITRNPRHRQDRVT